MKKSIGIYLRLSLEDVDKRTNKAKDESNSIVAQRQLIQRHIEQNSYLSNLPKMEFCDDGFSGTNFERPDFQRMIDLIRAGEIHIAIVKDLSRFGRDYLEVGDYLEHIFPFLGVRMISINDHYDSEKYLGNTAGMDIAFRNLIYDYYSKDLSKKVKSAMRTKQRNGGYITCCTYGYKVSPKNKHQMIIDPETAPIVRRIFTDVIAGKSTSQVARELNAEGIPTPQQYKGVARRKDSPSKALWTHNRILDMLKNIKYTGCMVNHTRESMVIRAKSQRRVPKEDWIYHENAHEAIVTTEEFYAIRYRIIHFTLAGGCFWTAAKHTYFFGAFSQRSTCNIHSGIACTDHCQMFAQIIYIGINEIINGKGDVTQAFPGDSKFFGTPYAGSYKNCLIAISLQVIHR